MNKDDFPITTEFLAFLQRAYPVDADTLAELVAKFNTVEERNYHNLLLHMYVYCVNRKKPLNFFYYQREATQKERFDFFEKFLASAVVRVFFAK